MRCGQARYTTALASATQTRFYAKDLHDRAELMEYDMPTEVRGWRRHKYNRGAWPHPGQWTLQEQWQANANVCGALQIIPSGL